MASKYSAAQLVGALRQCEIVSNVIFSYIPYRSSEKSSDQEEEAEQIRYPYALIITQDCDLEQDYEARQSKLKQYKMIPNIMFCPLLSIDFILEHELQEIKKKKGTTQNNILNNKDERYHFLQSVPPDVDLAGKGIAESVIEFKRVFTIPTQEVYARIQAKQIGRHCKLASPYLEHFAVRYAFYHTRVALPEQHESE